MARSAAPCTLAPGENVLPGFPAVSGAVDTTGDAGTKGVSQGGHVDEVGVGGVHPDAGDMAGVPQAKMRPGLPAVVGAVDTVAVTGVAADAGLSHAGVDHVGVGLCGGDCSDGCGVEKAVGNVLPVGTAVGGLPNAAGAGAEVEDAGVRHVSGDGYDAAAAVGAD